MGGGGIDRELGEGEWIERVIVKGEKAGGRNKDIVRLPDSG